MIFDKKLIGNSRAGGEQWKEVVMARNASNIHEMSLDNPDYGFEKQKNRSLEDIAARHGFEVAFFNLSEYLKSGATIVDTREEVFVQADMIVKVKEPLPEEYPLFRKGQIRRDAASPSYLGDLLQNKGGYCGSGDIAGTRQSGIDRVPNLLIGDRVVVWHRYGEERTSLIPSYALGHHRSNLGRGVDPNRRLDAAGACVEHGELVGLIAQHRD